MANKETNALKMFILAAKIDMDGIGNAFGDLFLLLTKSLPSDEERLARFKLRSPLKYARIKYHLLCDICHRAIKQGLTTNNESLQNFVMLETDDLADSEQKSFMELVPVMIQHAVKK